MKHTEYVADTEAVLIGLSNIANLSFTQGEFSSFEDEFSDSGVDEIQYIIKGADLEVSVFLEKYEGYFLVSISGSGKVFDKSKNISLKTVAKATNNTLVNVPSGLGRFQRPTILALN
jgi:hypothetical protein